MFADTPSVCPFTFAIYDLSGGRLGPIWERFVRCLPATATVGTATADVLDADDLLAQAEMLLDCAAHLDNYTRYKEPVWSTGFYITHTIHEYGDEEQPAVLRAYPSLPGRRPTARLTRGPPEPPGVAPA
jgi:hypothetical protein